MFKLKRFKREFQLTIILILARIKRYVGTITVYKRSSENLGIHKTKNSKHPTQLTLARLPYIHDFQDSVVFFSRSLELKIKSRQQLVIVCVYIYVYSFIAPASSSENGFC